MTAHNGTVGGPRLNIVVGVTGGIAAYKAVSVIRQFVLLGHDVHVVATAAALRFVGEPTFEAISRNRVEIDLYEGVSEVRHVALGQQADLIVVVPATAHTIARLAIGLADDLLTNTVLASSAPLVIAPAMHTEMWENPATQANIATLTDRGARIVGPGSGALTGRDAGVGRLDEPDSIVAAALGAQSSGRSDGVTSAPLRGKHVVISAGGTREPLDPVRFLGNRSSGRQGAALAQAALALGAEVTVVAAHVETDLPERARVIPVETTQDLRSAMNAQLGGADIVIMAAAVADYRPRTVHERKIKKDDSGDGMSMDLVRNPDVLVELSARATEAQVVIGFAAETIADRTGLIEAGTKKIARKGCDFLVLNEVGWSKGFATEDNRVVVLGRGGDIVLEAAGTKVSVAQRILEAVISA